MASEAHIIGGGLAGACLAWRLHWEGVSFTWRDRDHLRRASNVGAGIVNPITGRKFALSWNFPVLLEEAKVFYTRAEKELGTSYFQKRRLYRALKDHRDEQEWDMRSDQEASRPYIGKMVSSQSLPSCYHYSAEIFGEVLQAHQLHIAAFVQASWDYMSAHYECSKNEAPIPWSKSYSSSLTFLAEGATHIHADLFPLEHVHRTKGDVLIIRAPHIPEDLMVKERFFIVPTSRREHFWVGSNYEHEALSDEPSQRLGEILREHLNTRMRCDFEIVDHISAYRPTTVDRKPIVGCHPETSQLVLCNGLGTKGASLGPWTTKTLLEHVFEAKDLPHDISLHRFL